MSNLALEIQLSNLQSELRAAEEYNAHLKSELAVIESGVSNADNELSAYNTHMRGELEACSSSIKSSRERAAEVLELQDEIQKLYVRFKNIELANKRIRAANNAKYYEHANYRAVRKIMRGLMDSFNMNAVSDEVILKSVEFQHLQTPDYWLTCVLISVMAWKRDEKELADRAISRAAELDKKKSSIFYMLFNIRMERDAAAMKWFRSFCQCNVTGEDERTFLLLFALVSRTAGRNADVELKNSVCEYIKRITDLNFQDAGFREDDITLRINGYLDRTRPRGNISYDSLRRYCTDSGTLTEALMRAKNNINILEFARKVKDVPEEEKSSFTDEFIDELIALPNEAEKGAADEIAYNDLVIKLDGDVEAAAAKFEELNKRKTDGIDLVSEMTELIYDKDNADVNAQMRLNMFTLTKRLQRKAVDAYRESYKKLARDEYTVAIDDYSASVRFSDEDSALTDIETFCELRKEDELELIRNYPAYIGFAAAAASAVGSFFTSFWLLILTALGTGFGALTLVMNFKKKNEIERRYDEKAKNVSGIMRAVFEDWLRYSKELAEYDSYYSEIVSEIDSL